MALFGDLHQSVSSSGETSDLVEFDHRATTMGVALSPLIMVTGGPASFYSPLGAIVDGFFDYQLS